MRLHQGFASPHGPAFEVKRCEGPDGRLASKKLESALRLHEEKRYRTKVALTRTKTTRYSVRMAPVDANLRVTNAADTKDVDEKVKAMHEEVAEKRPLRRGLLLKVRA